MKLFGSVLPFAVGKYEAGFIFGYQLFELRSHVPVHIFANGAVGVVHPYMQAVGPFGQRVVKAHLQTGIANRCGQFPHNVLMGASHHAVPVGLVAAGPQAVSVVVFGHQHHVFCSRLGKELCPLVRIPVLSKPSLGIKGIEVGESGFLLYGVAVAQSSAPLVSQQVAPTFVEVEHLCRADAVAQHQPSVEPFGISVGGRVGGNGIEPPVYKYTQFGILKPLGIASLVQ